MATICVYNNVLFVQQQPAFRPIKDLCNCHNAWKWVRIFVFVPVVVYMNVFFHTTLILKCRHFDDFFCQCRSVCEWVGGGYGMSYVNTLRPRENGHHFVDDILNCVFLMKIVAF